MPGGDVPLAGGSFPPRKEGKRGKEREGRRTAAKVGEPPHRGSRRGGLQWRPLRTPRAGCPRVGATDACQPWNLWVNSRAAKVERSTSSGIGGARRPPGGLSSRRALQARAVQDGAADPGSRLPPEGPARGVQTCTIRGTYGNGYGPRAVPFPMMQNPYGWPSIPPLAPEGRPEARPRHAGKREWWESCGSRRGKCGGG